MLINNRSRPSSCTTNYKSLDNLSMSFNRSTMTLVLCVTISFLWLNFAVLPWLWCFKLDSICFLLANKRICLTRSLLIPTDKRLSWMEACSSCLILLTRCCVALRIVFVFARVLVILCCSVTHCLDEILVALVFLAWLEVVRNVSRCRLFKLQRNASDLALVRRNTCCFSWTNCRSWLLDCRAWWICVFNA